MFNFGKKQAPPAGPPPRPASKGPPPRGPPPRGNGPGGPAASIPGKYGGVSIFGGAALPPKLTAQVGDEEQIVQGELGWADEFYRNNPIVDSKPLSKLEKLHRYCSQGDVGEVRELIGTPEKLATQRGAVGNVAVHFAAQGGQWEVVEHLAGAGLDLNAQNDNGDTPLHQAVAKGHLRVVQVLVKGGALRDIANMAGKCAPELARTDEMKAALPEVDPTEAAGLVLMANDDEDDDDDDW